MMCVVYVDDTIFASVNGSDLEEEITSLGISTNAVTIHDTTREPYSVYCIMWYCLLLDCMYAHCDSLVIDRYRWLKWHWHLDSRLELVLI